MEDIFTVILLSLLPGAGNFLGALAAEARAPSARSLNWALHAASGIVIAIVAVELIPGALEQIAGWWVALAFAIGGLSYIALDSIVKRLQGTSDSAGNRRMWMIYAAVAIDLMSDGLMTGTGASVSLKWALVLSAGQVLADVPEGYAAAANFRSKGIARARRISLSVSFFVYVVGAAVAAYFLLRGAPGQIKAGGLAVVSGLLAVGAIEDMLQEAHDVHVDSQPSVIAFIGGFSLFTLVSAGLGAFVGR